MKSTLVDAGPLIALFDRSDAYHEPVLGFARDQKLHFVTTWPVITEAFHMLKFSTMAQINLLQWVRRDGVEIFSMSKDTVVRLEALIRKYENVPMDLADASLIAAAEETGIKTIVTLDSDFVVYRLKGKTALKNIFTYKRPL